MSQVVSVKAIVNDVEIDLEQNTETRLWEATAVAPAKSSYTQDDHYYGVTLIAEDAAGNTTTIDATDTEFGEALRLVVKETVAPVITITSPTEGELTSNPQQTIAFTVTDDDSGVDLDSIEVTINGTAITGISNTAIEGGYSFTAETDALEDGEYEIKITAADHDGNTTESSVNFKVQSTAPSLSITSPADEEYLNNASVTVSGTTDGATVTVSINGGEPIIVEVVDGEFSQVFDLEEGENTIEITATSESGVDTTITRTVFADTHAPIFKSITLSPNPADAGSTYIISVEVVDE